MVSDEGLANPLCQEEDDPRSMPTKIMILLSEQKVRAMGSRCLMIWKVK